MATPLPYVDWIKVPVQWSGSKAETVFRASGAGRLSVSHGLKPTIYSATLEYIIEAEEAQMLLEALEAVDHNKAYEFTCNTAGLVRVYVVGVPSYDERQAGQKVRVLLPVERRV